MSPHYRSCALYRMYYRGFFINIMWNPFKTQQLKPNYRIVKKTEDLVKHKYNITIKMQNGELFKTELYDTIEDTRRRICLVYGYYDNWPLNQYYDRSPKAERIIEYKVIESPQLKISANWKFDYQGTIMTLNSDQISWINYTKIPFESIQVENEVLELIEEKHD